MMLEKIMLGEKWNGLGHSGMATRQYVYANSSAVNVSESEMMNNHIPNFLEFVEKGDRPPSHSEPALSAVVTWDDIPYPQT